MFFWFYEIFIYIFMGLSCQDINSTLAPYVYRERLLSCGQTMPRNRFPIKYIKLSVSWHGLEESVALQLDHQEMVSLFNIL